jgi:hypothetical protein
MSGVFYVRDSGGEKILEEEQIQEIRQSIISTMR